MSNDNLNNRDYGNDEINLRQLAKSLKERSRFIFGFTGIITLLAIAYVLVTQTLTPPPTAQYKVEISFLKPSDSTVLNLNKFQLLRETKDSIYTKFLNLVGSKSFQKSVFLDGDYVNKFNETNEPIDDFNKYALRIINSTQLSVFEIDSKGNSNSNSNSNSDSNYEAFTKIELPYILSIKGENPDVLSEFLGDLASKANIKTVLNIAKLEEQEISNRLEQITLEKNMLLAKAKADRLSKILRIKEDDAQKIREVKNIIEKTRYKAKTELLNDIQRLTAAAKLAGSLGIIENNLGKINDTNNHINLNTKINDDEFLPEWYLFGEKALLEKVEILKSRTSNDPFIPELVSLNNQIYGIQNNNLLQTLEERQDDSPFIKRISELNIESAKLKSSVLDMSGIDAMKIQHYALASDLPMSIPSNLRNMLLIVGALFGGFVISIILAGLINFFKEEETE